MDDDAAGSAGFCSEFSGTRLAGHSDKTLGKLVLTADVRRFHNRQESQKRSGCIQFSLSVFNIAPDLCRKFRVATVPPSLHRLVRQCFILLVDEQ
jgi:hypothetical protein